MEPTHANIKPATKLNRMAGNAQSAPVAASNATHVASGKPSAYAPGVPKPATSVDSARAQRAAEVAKEAPAKVEPSDSISPLAVAPSASTPAPLAAPTKAAAVTPAPTHVSVPVATLQAMHDAYMSHADAIRALLPVTDTEADLAARTAARLKAQGA